MKLFILKKIVQKIALCLTLLAVISGCGGGGQPKPAVEPDPINSSSSNWDSMKWDDDNWG